MVGVVDCGSIRFRHSEDSMYGALGVSEERFHEIDNCIDEKIKSALRGDCRDVKLSRIIESVYSDCGIRDCAELTLAIIAASTKWIMLKELLTRVPIPLVLVMDGSDEEDRSTPPMSL